MNNPGKQNTANSSQNAIGGDGVGGGGGDTVAVTVGSANGKAIGQLSSPIIQQRNAILLS